MCDGVLHGAVNRGLEWDEESTERFENRENKPVRVKMYKLCTFCLFTFVLRINQTPDVNHTNVITVNRHVTCFVSVRCLIIAGSLKPTGTRFRPV